MFELRLKRLKERWVAVQAKREQIKEAKARWNYYRKEYKSLSQKIPKMRREEEKMLDEYNEAMV